MARISVRNKQYINPDCRSGGSDAYTESGKIQEHKHCCSSMYQQSVKSCQESVSDSRTGMDFPRGQINLKAKKQIIMLYPNLGTLPLGNPFFFFFFLLQDLYPIYYIIRFYWLWQQNMLHLLMFIPWCRKALANALSRLSLSGIIKTFTFLLFHSTISSALQTDAFFLESASLR